MTATYRAACWISDDRQAELVLTGPEHAALPSAELIAEARAELARAGGIEDGGRIEVADWTDPQRVVV